MVMYCTSSWTRFFDAEHRTLCNSSYSIKATTKFANTRTFFSGLHLCNCRKTSCWVSWRSAVFGLGVIVQSLLYFHLFTRAELRAAELNLSQFTACWKSRCVLLTAFGEINIGYSVNYLFVSYSRCCAGLRIQICSVSRSDSWTAC